MGNGHEIREKYFNSHEYILKFRKSKLREHSPRHVSHQLGAIYHLGLFDLAVTLP